MILLALALAAPPPLAEASGGGSTVLEPGRGVVVTTERLLVATVAAAQPGDLILIAPGIYKTTIRFNQANSGAAGRPVVLRARDGRGTVVIDGDGGHITLKFSGARHVEVSDLEITGGGYHGVFFDYGAHHITLRGNRIYDNHRIRPLNSHAEVKGSGGHGRPFGVAILDNEIFHRSHPPGGNFQGIDCNQCDGFRIEGNHLHDIHAPTAQPYSYYDRGACLQFKSGSRGTIIAGNRIARCNIGIVYGGEGLESPEHWGGIVTNNLIHDSAELAIAIVNVRSGKVYHNTLFNNGDSIRVAADGRHPAGRSEVEVANNILDGPIRELDGSPVAKSSNHVLSGRAEAGLFTNAQARDLRLRPSARAVIDRGADLGTEVAQDHAGVPRPQGRAPDIGAFEYQPETSR